MRWDTGDFLMRIKSLTDGHLNLWSGSHKQIFGIMFLAVCQTHTVIHWTSYTYENISSIHFSLCLFPKTKCILTRTPEAHIPVDQRASEVTWPSRRYLVCRSGKSSSTLANMHIIAKGTRVKPTHREHCETHIVFCWRCKDQKCSKWSSARM